MTKEEAKKLRTLIRWLVRAEIAWSEKGLYDAESLPYIKRRVEKRRKAVEGMVESITRKEET